MNTESSPSTSTSLVLLLLTVANILSVLGLLCSTNPVVLGICLVLTIVSSAGFCLTHIGLTHRLRASEAKIASIINSMPLPTAVLSPEGKIQTVNHAFEELTDWKRTELINQEWSATLLAKHEREHFDRMVLKTTTGRSIQGHTATIVTRAGKGRKMEWHSRRLCEATDTANDLLVIGIDTTDQCTDERIRTDTAELIRLSTKAAKLAFFDLDLVNKRFEVSPEYASMLGYAPEAFLETQTQWLERLHPDDHKTVRETFQAFIREGLPTFEVEYRIRTKSGHWLWVLSTASVVARDSSGTAIRILGILKNIDSRKQAQVLAKADAERYKALLHTAAEGIHVLDSAGNVVEVNPAFCKMLGYSYEEAIQLNVADWDAQWSPDELLIKINQLKLQPAVFETRHRRKDGTVFEAEVTATAVELDGRLLLYASSRDVTDRNSTESKLRASEERFRGIYDNAPDAIFILGAEENDVGRIMSCNRRAELMHGCRPGELLGKRITEIESVNSAESYRERMIPILFGEQSSFEVEHYRTDGSIFPLEVTATSVQVGSLRYFIVFGRDITDRRIANFELQFEHDRLRQILNAQFALVILTTPDGCIVEANQSTILGMGVSQDSIVGCHLYDLGAFQLDLKLEIKNLLETARRGEVVRRDLVLNVTGRDHRDVDATVSPIVNAEGEVTHLLFFGVDVTARKETEQKLLHESNFVNAVIENAGSILLVLDRDGRIQRFNRAAEILSGYRFCEIRGNCAWDTLLPPEIASTVKTEAFDVLKSDGRKATRKYTNEWLSRSGDRHTIDWTNTTIHNANGDLEFVVSIGVDVTEHRRIAKALRDNEARLRTIVESEPECVKTLDAECRVIDINKSGLIMLCAKSKEQVVGRSVIEFVCEEYHESFRNCVAAVFRGESTKLRFEVVALDGRRRWLDQHSAPLWSEGQPRCVMEMLSVTRDVTETVEISLKLQHSQSCLAEAQRLAQIGSWNLNIITGQLDWSDEVYGLFELEAGTCVASYEEFLNIIHPEDRELVNNAYIRSLENFEPYCVTHRLQMKDGRIKYVEERCVTEFDSARTPLRSRGTIQDVTQRVAAEQATLESLREKEALLREVHHRVKNNLQIVLSLIRLENSKNLNASTRRSLTDLQTRIHSMAILHELLYSTGRFASLDMKAYLTKLATQALQMSLETSRHIHLDLSLSALELTIDQAIPCGMLVNELISNSLKHAFPDGCHGNVKLELLAVGNGAQWMVRVSDTGVGLPMDFQLRRKGSLGLQLASDLATQLGGPLLIGPWPSATFSVTFLVKSASSGG